MPAAHAASARAARATPPVLPHGCLPRSPGGPIEARCTAAGMEYIGGPCTKLPVKCTTQPQVEGMTFNDCTPPKDAGAQCNGTCKADAGFLEVDDKKPTVQCVEQGTSTTGMWVAVSGGCYFQCAAKFMEAFRRAIWRCIQDGDGELLPGGRQGCLRVPALRHANHLLAA